jgi:glutamate-ammonia-ligase adenylyltransferase
MLPEPAMAIAPDVLPAGTPDAVAAGVARALAAPALAAAIAVDASGGAQVRLARVALASDFAIGVLAAQPALLAACLADDAETAWPLPVLDGEPAAWESALRRYRQAGSARLVWRDVHGVDGVDDTLAGSTHLAETCIARALEAIEVEHAARFGSVRDASGGAQRLVVFGLGKLGGGELNFSSDVDLVYAHAEPGTSDGARREDAERLFTRQGQQLFRLLDATTADGFCHRVDLRLRPHGNAGPVVPSFAAMEAYFQNEGRDWERYAWQKARPVAGDLDAGWRLLARLRPFVYRRYLDYGALESLRAMKASIAAEVARRELADDIKRGPGGIREIEFLVQALQLIRAGREPALQQRSLLPALAALVAAGQVREAVAADLAAAYRFLRRLENRLQMLADQQVHALPGDAVTRVRLALGLGYRDWPALAAALAVQRGRVAEEFAALLAPRRPRRHDDALQTYWQALPEAGAVAALEQAGFVDAEACDAWLRDFARAPALRELSPASRLRLDRVLPALLSAAAATPQPDAALQRLLGLLRALLRRANYLALLDEQPAALKRLAEVLASSAFLAERIGAHPLLLDELLDARIGGPVPEIDALHEAVAACVQDDDDAETRLRALNEVRASLSFRIALAVRDGRLTAVNGGRLLAALADAVVAQVLRLACAELHAVHGRVPGARFAVLGYGSLGGEELGIGSDLDLVFLHAAPAGAESDGARPLDAARWAARLAQKVVALLELVTPAGRLYAVDMRLRPDGAKGLLVASLTSFADYQRERAWTWERQALVRARGVAGDAALLAEAMAVRDTVLGMPREADALAAEVASMRRRMRAELDRSDATRFDLKQGAGGLVDLEFLAQWCVLRHAAAHPALCRPRHTDAIFAAAAAAGVLSGTETDALRAAHATLVTAGWRCTLDRRPRLVVPDAALGCARASVRAAAAARGLGFDAADDR